MEYPQYGNQNANLQPALFVLFRSESTKWLCISLSAAMTMQNVVNPTFKEEERVPS